MAKNLTHHQWVAQQFEDKYLISSYRNVLIHASIIEGTLRNESDKKDFNSANIFLCNESKRIVPLEYKTFDKIRIIRNKLVHDSFRNKLEQNKIDSLRDELMSKIHEAYRISNFLNIKLFEEYKIKRPAHIAFYFIK